MFTRIKNSLLETVQANINKVDGTKNLTVRVILDNGSNRSYITEEASRCLGLEAIAQENLSISVFGQSQYTPRGCVIVQVMVKGKKGGSPVCITATVVPYICSQLQMIKDPSWFKTNYSCFKNLEPADARDDGHTPRSSVDILVGSDFYWAVVENEIIRSPNGPVALKN